MSERESFPSQSGGTPNCQPSGQDAVSVAAWTLTATWQFTRAPRAPQYWRAAPAEIRPHLGIDTSSMTGLLQGCCLFPSGSCSLDHRLGRFTLAVQHQAPQTTRIPPPLIPPRQRPEHGPVRASDRGACRGRAPAGADGRERDPRRLGPSSRVQAALRAVPRHRFVPEAPLETAYDDEIAVTTVREDGGAVVSSVSAPWLQADMAEQLRLEPGTPRRRRGPGWWRRAEPHRREG